MVKIINALIELSTQMQEKSYTLQLFSYLNMVYLSFSGAGLKNRFGDLGGLRGKYGYNSNYNKLDKYFICAFTIFSLLVLR